MSKKYILLIEEDQSDAEFLQEKFKEAGTEVDLQRVASPQRGIVRLEEETFDVVIVATNGKSSCAEKVHRIRDRAPDVPLIVLSTHDDEDIALQLMAKGVQDYLVKEHITSYVLRRSVSYAVERKSWQDRLTRMAYIDPLTGCVSRYLFPDRLQSAIARAERNSKVVALLFVDLDGFKEVNDTFGHTVGDELLKEVANRLKLATRRYDTVARYGGDEFLVVLEDLSDEAESIGVVERIVDVISRPVSLREHEHVLSVSVGIASYPKHGKNIINLMDFSDKAMYRAKRDPGKSYYFYDEVE